MNMGVAYNFFLDGKFYVYDPSINLFELLLQCKTSNLKILCGGTDVALDLVVSIQI